MRDLVLVGLVTLILAIGWVTFASGPARIEGVSTINECAPGEDPSTTLCYDPDLPNE